MLITLKSFSSYADNKNLYKCTDKDIKIAFYETDTENVKGLSGKKKYCLAKAFIKHFEIGWLDQILPPTSDELKWYWKAHKKAVETRNLGKLRKKDLYLKIDYYNNIECIITRLKKVNRNSYPQKHFAYDSKIERILWSDFFSYLLQWDIWEKRQELIKRKIIEFEYTGSLNCNIAPSCLNHVLIPWALKAVFYSD